MRRPCASGFHACIRGALLAWLLVQHWTVVAAFSLSNPLSSKSFRELYGDRFPEWLLGRLEACGYKNPTLVQERALDTILNGDDVLLHAQTGSGKTLAYLLSMLVGESVLTQLF